MNTEITSADNSVSSQNDGRHICVGVEPVPNGGDPFADMIAKYGRLPETSKSKYPSSASPHRSKAYWKYGIVALSSLLIGVLIGIIAFQSKVISLHEKIESIEAERASDRGDSAIKLLDAESSGYEIGYDSGYKDGYDNADESLYNEGYADAKKQAERNISFHLAMLSGAIENRDWQTIDFLVGMNPEEIVS